MKDFRDHAAMTLNFLEQKEGDEKFYYLIGKLRFAYNAGIEDAAKVADKKSYFMTADEIRKLSE